MLYGATLYDQRDVRVVKACRIENLIGSRKPQSDAEFVRTNPSPRDSIAYSPNASIDKPQSMLQSIQDAAKAHHQQNKKSGSKSDVDSVAGVS